MKQKNTDEERLPIFDSESIDSRPVVHKLAAALGERMGSVFYTHTCNMKCHFGMKLLKNWLESELSIDGVIDQLCSKRTFTEEQREEIHENMQLSTCSLALQCWINVSDIWMAYITKSPEEPVGKVDNIWMKRELQETKGNVPHIHSILWLAEDDGTPQGVMKVVQCSRASISMMLSSDEYSEMKNQGILSSQEELLDILQTLSTILPHHHHRRCAIVKNK